MILPEIADYELRREFIRRRASNALANLDYYGVKLEYLPISTFAMQLAAELWAQARSMGQPTAPDWAIDADAILAAQALSLNLNVIVATANPAHLARFVPADLWQNIRPLNTPTARVRCCMKQSPRFLQQPPVRRGAHVGVEAGVV